MIFRYLIIIIFLGILINSCDFPYAPKLESGLTGSGIDPISNTDADVVLRPININKQVCNPSISLDTINFKSCMLWLNFGGPLSVKVPASSGYSITNAGTHDRLTITDTSNTVKWHIMKDAFPDGDGIDVQLQDPEWSAHPEYIVTLLGDVNFNDKWSFYVIHPVTSSFVKICNQNLNETSTPHLWVSSSIPHGGAAVANPVYDNNGLLDKASIKQFFGTDEVKISYSRKENNCLSIYYVDYSVSDVKPVKLKRPIGEDKKFFNYESALISPDGKWIVYNAYLTTKYYESFIQELNPNSTPILLKAGAADPHWWVNPKSKQNYIIYTEIPGDNRILSNLDNPEFLQTGEIGKTFRQRVFLSPGLPSVFSLESDNPKLIVNLPLKGGLSPDGRFLCTGYNYAYIVSFK